MCYLVKCGHCRSTKTDNAFMFISQTKYTKQRIICVFVVFHRFTLSLTEKKQSVSAAFV